MKKNMGRRAQETGPLQNIMFALLFLGAAGFAMFTFYDGMITNYDTPALSNESQFTAFQESTDNTTQNINEIRDTIQGANGTAGASDIILEITTRGFSVLTEIIAGPIIVFNTVINVAFEALGVPAYLQGLAYVAVLVIALFAIIALIMKVRA